MIIVFNKKVRKFLSFGLIFTALVGGIIYFNKNNITPTSKEKVGDINGYTIDVIFDDESKRLMCNQTITYINNTGKSLDSLYFHIYPNAFSKKEFAPFEKSEMKMAYPNGFNEGYIDIKNILSNNKDLSYSITGEKEDILEVKLKNKLKPNEQVSLDMEYNIKLPNSVGRFGYGDSTVNVTNWFPMACVYDDRGWNTKSYEMIGDPFYSEISNFDVTILVPKTYKIGSTGKVIESKNNKNKSMYTIEADNVRDFAFILSNKFDIDNDSIDNIKINTYNLDKKFSEFTTEVAKDSIKIFSDMFGKYPYDTYSVIASDFYIGGMEYPTLSMIDQSLYTENNKFLLEYVIAHETAHQWWYSAIGNDEISEPWIDEALTEYSTVLYFEKKYGEEVANKLIKSMEIETRKYSSEDIFKSTTQYKDSIDYSLNVYTKGAVIFHKIREEVGDKLFFETLKEYYQTYLFKNVNAVQFVELWNKKGIDFDDIINKYK